MIGGIFRSANLLRNKTVQVWELDRATVKGRLAANAPWASIATARQALNFSGLQLAHAVVKADFQTKQNPFLPGLGFLLQCHDIIDLRTTPNLRVVDDLELKLNDFAFTGFCGRIAQGISILFAAQRGYAFVGHLASAVGSVAHGTRVADFLFENTSNDRMILESKGSFSRRTNEPKPIKSVLKNALEEQVEPWLARITPLVQKGFATYTCIRGTSDFDDSAIIFVDPPGMLGGEPLELGSSWVRRRNYAGWLDAMGLADSAERLRGADGERGQNISLPIIQRRGLKIAVVPTWDPINPNRIYGMGVELGTLKSVEQAVAGDDAAIMAHEGVSEEVRRFEGDIHGSMMADGTFLGLMELKDLLSVEEFKL